MGPENADEEPTSPDDTTAGPAPEDATASFDPIAPDPDDSAPIAPDAGAGDAGAATTPAGLPPTPPSPAAAPPLYADTAPRAVPPTPPVPPAPAAPPPGGDRPSGRGKAVVATAVAVVLVGAAAFAVVKIRKDDPEPVSQPTAPAESTSTDEDALYLQPANDLGPDSFAETALESANPAAAAPADLKPVTKAESRKKRPVKVRVVTGGAVGLYGGTTKEKVCDREKLIAFLTAPKNRGKAQAWVAGLNEDRNLRWSGGRLTVAKIPTYVRSELTPALVLRDTLVVNHGYAGNGRPTTFRSYLEAGTKAFVDKYGVFRVRCLCGNPLIGPRTDTKKNAKILGKRWPKKKPITIRTTATPSPSATPSATASSSASPSPSPSPTVTIRADVNEVVVIRPTTTPLPTLPIVKPDGSVVTIRTATDALAKDVVTIRTTPTPTPTPSASPSTTASTTPTEACSKSFCVPLNPGWSVTCKDAEAGCGSATLGKLRLVDGKGVVYELTESDLTDPKAVLDKEKARLEGLNPPCQYVGTRDPLTRGAYTVFRDKWVRTASCPVVNTAAVVSTTSGRVILGGSTNDGELVNLLFAGMRFL